MDEWVDFTGSGNFLLWCLEFGFRFGLGCDFVVQ